jgi:L-asparagine transporter-like permease
MRDIRSAEPRPQQSQAPQATPDGNAIASLIFGILGLIALPLIGSILAVIFGHMSTRDARERGERPSTMATAGTVLGWIGLIVPIAAFVILFFAGTPRPVLAVMLVLTLAIYALVTYYVRRKNRR